MSDADATAPIPPATGGHSELQGLDPGELLARGLHTVKPSGGAAWEPPPPEEVGRLLPQYRIEKLIGRGGMGAVYKGVQLTLDRLVAIKLLPAEVAADAEFVTRFEREAHTLAKLQHSRIVTIHDFGQTAEGHLYFIMEYIDGTDLRRILKGPGLDPEQALAVVGQLCDALQAAHREGIVHRDIKPENVLITRDGYVKLADFGLSRPPQEDGAPQLTNTNVVMGTPDYMAPEQRDGAAKADHRSDIFALGVMFYEMLTGQPPRGVFAPPSHKVAVDARVDQVVLKALQSEPDRRYQQASELKTDVDQIRTTPQPAAVPGESLPAQAASVPAAKGRFSMVAVAAVVLVALLGGAGYLVRQKGRTAAAPPLTDSVLADQATKEQPFVNSLGMKFVPVSGSKTLFCVWETRVRDYAEYAKNNEVNPMWRDVRWAVKKIADQPNDPVLGVNFYDANGFCRWLTAKEIAAGKLPAGQCYRLPTDREWSLAIGLGVEDGRTPAERSDTDPTRYLWGADYPPKSKVGNYADVNFKNAHRDRMSMANYDDGFELVAPVGSFPANEYGIYDLGGNAAEWCLDLYHPGGDAVLLRGSAFKSPQFKASELLASHRMEMEPHSRLNWAGFRCVLAVDEPLQGIASTVDTSAGLNPNKQPPAQTVPPRAETADRLRMTTAGLPTPTPSPTPVTPVPAVIAEVPSLANSQDPRASAAKLPPPSSIPTAYPPTKPPQVVTTPPMNLEQTLSLSTWTWGDGGSGFLHFRADHTGAETDSKHNLPFKWDVVSGQTIQITIVGGGSNWVGRVAKLTFRNDASGYDGTGFIGNKMSGTKVQNSVGESSSVRAAPPVSANSRTPTTLEEAVLGYHWSWVNPNQEPQEVRFYKDGTATTNKGKQWTWQITGPKKVRIKFSAAPQTGLTYVFDDAFTKFAYIDLKHYQTTGTRLVPVAPEAASGTSVPGQSRTSSPIAPPPVAPVVPPPAAQSLKSDQPMIEVLSDQAPNVANWITAPLDREVPPEIWQNMTFLKEALRDEALKHPAASQAAYGQAVRLCYTMVAYLEDRREAETLSGGDAVLHQKSNLTEWRRDHLTWPMYALERDERTERQEKAKKTKVFLGNLKMQEWANHSHDMRTVIDAQYEQFRDALRQSPPRK